jgi:alpha-beta hydrolase superfamily lysophospholipase
VTGTIGWVLVLGTAVGSGLLPSRAAAQAADFALLRGADTITTEHVTREAGRLRGELRITGGARVTYDATVDASELVPRMEFAYYAAGAAKPAVSGTLEFGEDSAKAQVSGGQVPREQRFQPGAGALPYVNLASGLLEQLVRRARAVGGDTVRVPMLAIENGQAFAATVAFPAPDSAVVTLPPAVQLHLRVDARGRLLGGTVPAQGLVLVRAGEAVAQLPRPDYSAPAGAPYTAEDVAIPTPRGYSLAGTLTLPEGATGPVPALVTITGSGPQDRDSAIPVVPGYRPFRQIADALTRRGIAVLRLDDRGVGASGGSAARATSADFADDVRAALAYLRTRPEIRGDELALLGHSEGGMIAPMVAVEDPGVKAVVLMAAPAWTGLRTSDYQLREAWTRMGLSSAQIDSAKAANDPKREAQAAAVPWLRYWLDYDPLPTARRLRAPVLILQGATDRQVAPEQAEELAAAIRSGGNRDVTVRVLPGLDHLFLADPSGTPDPAHYASLPSKDLPRRVLDGIADWLEGKLQ